MNIFNIKHLLAILKMMIICLDIFFVSILHNLHAYRGDIRDQDQDEPGAKITAALEVLMVGLTA